MLRENHVYSHGVETHVDPKTRNRINLPIKLLFQPTKREALFLRPFMSGLELFRKKEKDIVPF